MSLKNFTTARISPSPGSDAAGGAGLTGLSTRNRPWITSPCSFTVNDTVTLSPVNKRTKPNRSSVERCRNTSVSSILTNPYPLRSLYQTSSPSLTLISVTVKILKQSLTPCFGIELKIAEDGDG